VPNGDTYKSLEAIVGEADA
jgi:tRNA pseudouridine13 synthase